MWSIFSYCFGSAQQKGPQVASNGVKLRIVQPAQKGLQTILEDLPVISDKQDLAAADFKIPAQKEHSSNSYSLDCKSSSPRNASSITTRRHQQEHARQAKVTAMLEDWDNSHELFLAEKAALAQSRSYMKEVKHKAVNSRSGIMHLISSSSKALCNCKSTRQYQNNEMQHALHAHSRQSPAQDCLQTDPFGRIIHTAACQCAPGS